MKKLISTLLATTLSISTLTVPAIAEEDNISVYIDGERLEFEVEPQIINDRTMVPMRAIFEKLGYTVTWYPESKAIDAINRKTDTEIILTVDVPYISYCKPSIIDTLTDSDSFSNYVDSNTQALDIAPTIIEGSTLVPVRAISEGSGCVVSWDNTNRSVNINTKDSKENEYYDNTSIRTYTSVTGDEVMMTGGQNPTNPNVVYIYNYNKDSVNKYIQYLYSEGWVTSNTTIEDYNTNGVIGHTYQTFICDNYMLRLMTYFYGDGNDKVMIFYDDKQSYLEYKKSVPDYGVVTGNKNVTRYLSKDSVYPTEVSTCNYDKQEYEKYINYILENGWVEYESDSSSQARMFSKGLRYFYIMYLTDSNTISVYIPDPGY